MAQPTNPSSPLISRVDVLEAIVAEFAGVLSTTLGPDGADAFLQTVADQIGREIADAIVPEDTGRLPKSALPTTLVGVLGGLGAAVDLQRLTDSEIGLTCTSPLFPRHRAEAPGLDAFISAIIGQIAAASVGQAIVDTSDLSAADGTGSIHVSLSRSGQGRRYTR